MSGFVGQRCPSVPSQACPLRGADADGAAVCADLHRIQIVPRGDYLFSQGEDCLAIHAVLSGAIVLEYVDGAGGVAIMRLVRRGEMVGSADLFDGHEHRTSARVVEDALICTLPEASLMTAMNADGAFAVRLLRASAEETHAFGDFAQRMASLPVEARVLALIEDLSAGRPRFVLPISKKDLAFMAGTGPEVLSRTLMKLQKAGVIWMEGNTVTMQDPALDGRAARIAC
ncbi:Crp/Fnr family transcriptional regulator [Telmatospirillum sp.]|uniref:Crp/Fnr family transcriptional regulator n=1 Tax=Telmatospirillum sp. TaxID=2079197 RepID=UPI00284D17AC|nr:Crp/Fnr family transcriptional regulator [Telmatospirillum sp.]MDR3439400.1 Crp/Fnr family transcriptional regulator [Telmatospirillum sp.]